MPRLGNAVDGIDNAAEVVGFYGDEAGSTDGFVEPVVPVQYRVAYGVEFRHRAPGNQDAPQPVTMTNCAATPTVLAKYLFTLLTFSAKPTLARRPRLHCRPKLAVP